MSGALIAGISGAGKTTLYRKTNAAITASGREIVLAFPQSMTTTAHLQYASEPDRQAEHVLSWIDDSISFAERVMQKALAGGLVTQRENYPFNWNPMLLLEGFIFDIPLHGFAIKREDVLPFEHRLKTLGVVLAVLVVPPALIRRRCVESTRRHRGAGWSQHLDALGVNDDARREHFASQQELLLKWVSQSPLEAHIIEVTDSRSWRKHVNTVVGLIDSRARMFNEQTTFHLNAARELSGTLSSTNNARRSF